MIGGNNFYNFDLKQKVHSGLCIVFLLLTTFWVVFQYAIAKAYDIEHTLSVRNTTHYVDMKTGATE
jgi:hypothetical protein